MLKQLSFLHLLLLPAFKPWSVVAYLWATVLSWRSIIMDDYTILYSMHCMGVYSILQYSNSTLQHFTLHTSVWIRLHSIQPPIRGCSHIMSAKIGGVQTPPSPACQPKIRNWLTPPPPLVRKNQKSANPPFPPLSEIIFCCTPIIKLNTPSRKKVLIWKQFRHL